MSIVASELVEYSSASRPEDDVSTSGGAISLTHKHDITQLTANAVIAVISDGSDTRTVTVTGRLASGSIDTEALVLDGTNEVLGAKTFERITKLVLSTGSGTRTVLVKQGTGGATRATFLPNSVSKSILFQNSESAAGATVRHEKIFKKNEHGTLTLNAAAVTLTSDPDSRITIGCEAGKEGTQSVANRLAVPGSVTFVDDSVASAVPSNTLDAGEAIGVWIRQSLTGGDTAHRATLTTEVTGTSV